MDKQSWHLIAGHTADKHPTITESTTGIVACGHSWCSGKCGLPALILEHDGKELKAYGSMTAFGHVFQSWRVEEWKGAKVSVTLGDASVANALSRLWV